MQLQVADPSDIMCPIRSRRYNNADKNATNYIQMIISIDTNYIYTSGLKSSEHILSSRICNILINNNQ